MVSVMDQLGLPLSEVINSRGPLELEEAGVGELELEEE